MTCQVMRDGDMDPPPKELCTLTLTRICTAPSSALKGCPAFTRHFTAEHSMGILFSASIQRFQRWGLLLSDSRDCKWDMCFCDITLCTVLLWVSLRFSPRRGVPRADRGGLGPGFAGAKLTLESAQSVRLTPCWPSTSIHIDRLTIRLRENHSFKVAP